MLRLLALVQFFHQILQRPLAALLWRPFAAFFRRLFRAFLRRPFLAFFRRPFAAIAGAVRGRDLVAQIPIWFDYFHADCQRLLIHFFAELVEILGRRRRRSGIAAGFEQKISRRPLFEFSRFRKIRLDPNEFRRILRHQPLDDLDVFAGDQTPVNVSVGRRLKKILIH